MKNKIAIKVVYYYFLGGLNIFKLIEGALHCLPEDV